MAVGHIAARGTVESEHLSSLIDGELDAEQAASVLDALCRDPELQRRWSDLQLVGDALRSTEVAACHVEGFCARVPEQTDGAPSRDQLLADQAAALKRELRAAADHCIGEFKTNVLGV